MWNELVSSLHCSDGEAKHADDAVHGLVLPAYCAAAVGVVVPVARAGRVQTSAILLHDDASHNILEGLVQFGKLV